MSKRDPRVQRTHLAVAQVAGQILRERGWEHVTHANVAEAAGYARATLYKHWPRTGHLLLTAFEHLLKFELGASTGDLRTDLVAQLEGFRRVLMRDGLGNWLAAMADRAATDPAIRELRDQFLAEGQRQMVELIQQGIARGELRAVDDVEPVADMLSGAVAYRVAINGDPIDRGYLEAVVDIFLAAMRR